MNLARTDSLTTLQRARRASFIERRDGTALFYKDWGTGRPVLFIHGAGSDSDCWEPQMAEFVSAGFRCVAFDRRGHGRSSDSGRVHDEATLADDTAAVISTLNLQGVLLIRQA
jgi:non-heme chloroperoxidase